MIILDLPDLCLSLEQSIAIMIFMEIFAELETAFPYEVNV